MAGTAITGPRMARDRDKTRGPNWHERAVGPGGSRIFKKVGKKFNSSNSATTFNFFSRPARKSLFLAGLRLKTLA
jgi:hypothetical protein